MLEGVEASSQDYNQSIHRTLDRMSLDYFWSSKGHDTADANEWLIYKVASNKSATELAVINAVVISVFQPRFHPGLPFYPPQKVQIEVGSSPTKFEYKSPVYLVVPNTTAE